MITVIVGHRGSGKTKLLARIKHYDPRVAVVDLDAMIAAAAGQSITEIFQGRGEKFFRELERKYFTELALGERTQPLFIAVGAGFEMPLPPHVRCLWVRRPTDAAGRIFLDRPRLDPNVSQLETYHARFVAREKRYDEMSHAELTIPEGFDRENAAERDYFQHQLQDLGGIITLLPKHFVRAYTWYWFVSQRLGWGIDAFEMRDDQLTEQQIDQVLWSVPRGKMLYSYRAPTRASLAPPTGVRWDWDMTLGHCPFGTPPILSLHDRLAGESLAEMLTRLTTAGQGSILKAAPEVKNFAELEVGHRWALEDPTRRAFLPRSTDGRWRWYRLFMKGKAPLHFIREGTGSSVDQPYLLEWMREPGSATFFAAVLGDPVEHSLTPAEHGEYFASRGLPVFAIRVTEEEWHHGALDVLQRLGLRFAAVTSPLKPLLFPGRAVNTLAWDEREKKWCGTNTDGEGLQAALKKIDTRGAIAVWGGGGMSGVLHEAFPNASFYSARTGELKGGRPLTSPDLLVWASGGKGLMPPATWKPQHIFDLDYRQNASGLDFAERHGIPYTSGIEIFHAQAEGQRRFWKNFFS